MAEIKIEKKKPIWPWILIILIILAAILFFWFYYDNDMDSNDDVIVNDTITQSQVLDTTPVTIEETATVGYLTYIDNEKMGVDHEYTNEALNRLISATEEVARNNNVAIDANLEQARNYASQITDDPTSLDHANKIKSAAKEISSAITTIQEQRFSNLSSEAEQVRKAADKIKEKTPTLDQKDDIKDFFTKAGNLLQKMDNPNDTL